MEHVIRNFDKDMHVSRVTVKNDSTSRIFVLVMENIKILDTAISSLQNFRYEFNQQLIVKANAALKANHPFSIDRDTEVAEERNREG